MRLSVDEGDPGYDAYCRMLMGGSRAKVFLDKKYQEKVITADEELGLVVAFVLDENGKILFCDNEPATEDRFGPVQIEVLSRGGAGW